jgi:nucleoside-diphosphate-sugar epimerase
MTVVLVTGAAGMLGVHLIEQLLHGPLSAALAIAEVRAFDKSEFIPLGGLEWEGNTTIPSTGEQTSSKSRSKSPARVRKSAPQEGTGGSVKLVVLRGDMTNKSDVDAAVKGCDYVLHCCSLVDFGNVPRSLVWAVNVDGTAAILDCCRRHGVKGLIYTSTLDVCMPRTLPGLAGADESAPYVTGTHSVYVASKLRAERMCLAADSAACPVTVLRPPGIYGERSLYHIHAELVAACAAGEAHVFKIGLGEAVFQVSISITITTAPALTGGGTRLPLPAPEVLRWQCGPSPHVCAAGSADWAQRGRERRRRWWR